MPTRVWSKLEIQLREIADPVLDLRFRYTAYRQESIQTAHATEPAQKFWITQGKATLWAVPRDRHSGDGASIEYAARRSPSWLLELAENYLAVPRPDLLNWSPEWTGWGLADILKACDRRFGRRRWPLVREQITEPAAHRLLGLRAGIASASRFPAGGRNTAQIVIPS